MPNPNPPRISRNAPKMSSTISCCWVVTSVSLWSCVKFYLLLARIFLVWKNVSNQGWDCCASLRVKKLLRYLRERMAASVSTLSQRSILGKCTSCWKRNSYSLGSLLQCRLRTRSLRYSPISCRHIYGDCFRRNVLLISRTGMTKPPYFSDMSWTKCSTCRNLRTVIQMHSLLSLRQLYIRNSCSFLEFSLLSFTYSRIRSKRVTFGSSPYFSLTFFINYRFLHYICLKITNKMHLN